MKCSCHAPLVYSTASYVGTQFHRDTPTGDAWLVLALFNCGSCGSTRAAILHDSMSDEDEQLEAIAAE